MLKVPFGTVVFWAHARRNLRDREVSEREALFVLERGVRSPEVSDVAGPARFSFRAMIDGRWIRVIAEIESDRVEVVTVIA